MLSDVSGVTGQAIVKAILRGAPNPFKLAAFRDPRVKASEEQIARSLEGRKAIAKKTCCSGISLWLVHSTAGMPELRSMLSAEQINEIHRLHC